MPRIDTAAAILSGSCSRATNDQVARWSTSNPCLRIDPLALARGDDVVARALAWADSLAPGATPMFAATDRPEAVAAVQQRLGAQAAGQLVEKAFATLARALVDRGTRRLVVAGGETAGAVVQALAIDQLRVGPQIDPGVPWMVADDASGCTGPIALALKSGNFGAPDFFEQGAGDARLRRERRLRTCEGIGRARAARQDAPDLGAKHSHIRRYGEHLQRRAGACSCVERVQSFTGSQGSARAISGLRSCASRTLKALKPAVVSPVSIARIA